MASGERNTTEKLGVMVKNLTPEESQKLGMEGKQGVLVAEVDPGSLAARAGLHPGDVVTNINGQPVTDIDSFQAEVRKLDVKQGLRFQVLSQGMSHFVLLKDDRSAKHHG